MKDVNYTSHSETSTLKNVTIDGENYFKISNVDQMRPFFMSIVSDSNHWMFISSNGGLTAGRKNSEYALFPYYTDDKITELAEITGSKSICFVRNNEKTQLWEPFSMRQEGRYNVTRNLYKNTYGNKVIFEEINHDLQVTFRYQWSSSNVYGFVKTSKILNDSEAELSISVLDGLQNIMPYGVPSDTQVRVSNLVDAYKKSELIKDAGVGIYALSSIIVDKAEPSEALKANMVWSLGLDQPKYLLSSRQLKQFRQGEPLEEEIDVRAEKGAYFVQADINLPSGNTKEWMLIANVNQDHVAIAEIIHDIKTDNGLKDAINKDVQLGTQRLIALTASSDGLQFTADKQRDTRHFSNTLFNIMRGGVFDDNYTIEKWDLKNYLEKANATVFNTINKELAQLPEKLSLKELQKVEEASSDQDFKRLCREYLPLKFSRRHGDPSRPWNKFSINTRSEIDGSKILDYEGNWRDIFQNWEALAHAFPEFIEGMIYKFLNATTFDGYNPYRVTKDGFDWETIEPDDPWSYIGYWGDHQIIYLLKFLEFSEHHYPGKLAQDFKNNLFVYANVPYRIKAYSDILKNPKDTIDFDHDLDEHIREERSVIGADGALIKSQDGHIYHVNFMEKILATVLAKLSNFIPEAGIWLNTQRPEWNDANNALVGNGVSMVTLNYLYRFLTFFQDIVMETEEDAMHVSEELLTFFNGVAQTLTQNEALLEDRFSDKDRKTVLDGLGQAGSTYRMGIYARGFSGVKAEVKTTEIADFIAVALRYLKHTIDANKRADNMYHAYNLMTVTNASEVAISYLDEMLEGQVAALSSGYLSAQQELGVLDAMKHSALFREDQYSYLLYPNKNLARFMDKNTIPAAAVESSKLLKKLVADGHQQIITKDINGVFHFNGNFNNADSLKSALKDLKTTSYAELAKEDEKLILETFEKVFNHKAFTGRSGTFYGYEGLGSIYWHMVSKLLLAVQESCLRAIRNQENPEIIGKLLEHYYEINEGIGVHKPPQLYGAFPTDPYSHTPSGKGAQQPGMTGQVKEDILSRIGELGVFVFDGKLKFHPCMLRKDEFLTEKEMFTYVDIDHQTKTLEVLENELAFTYCQVPIIYQKSTNNAIHVYGKDGTISKFEGQYLDATTSKSLFQRIGSISKIEVSIDQTVLK